MNLLLAGFGGNGIHSSGVFNAEAEDYLFKDYKASNSFLCQHKNITFGITEFAPCALYIYKDFVLTDTLSVEGENLCHISFLSEQNLLIGSFYFSGTLVSVKVDVENGKFISSPIYYNQSAVKGDSRAHCAVLGKDNLVYSANIQQDLIYLYKVLEDRLEQEDIIELPKGVGPRHILPVSNNKLFVITEYSNEILLIENKKFVKSVSTLPPNSNIKSYGSTLCLTKDEKFLYAGNRGHDSIAVFSMTDDFIKPIGHFSCGGSHPRHIALCDNDSKIISTNQNSDNITILNLDETTGLAKGIFLKISFRKPSFAQELL